MEIDMAPVQDWLHDLWGPVKNKIVGLIVQKSIKDFKMAIAEH